MTDRTERILIHVGVATLRLTLIATALAGIGGAQAWVCASRGGSIMPRLHHLARRIRTTTAAGLVPLLLLTSVPACATRAHRSASPAVSAEAQPVARPLSEWSRVEAVPVGTLIDVQLYGDAAPPDRQKVTGRLHAVTADTLTVVLYEGQRIVRPLPRSDVHIVQTRRPIERRWKGWLTFLSVPVGFLGFITILTGGDFVFGKVLELGVKFGALASLPGFLLHRWQRIYEVPPAAARLINQVDVPVTDGDVVPRSLEVSVSVSRSRSSARNRSNSAPALAANTGVGA